MAVSQSQPTFTLVAGATFTNSDLYKFVAVNSSGHAVINDSTNSANVVGTLCEPNYSTSGAGSEAVTIGALVGKGKVRMGGSTSHQGNTVAASSAGFGIAPSTDGLQLGIIAVGSSGTTGRVATVVFGPTFAV